MALRATVFRVRVALSDIDHHCYTDLAHTVARHPSETDERMMVRVAALALHQHEVVGLHEGAARLEFGPGLSTPGEPDVQCVDDTGRIRLWVAVGQPDETLIKRALSRADQVVVYAYGRTSEVWWRGLQNKLPRVGERLQVWRLDSEATQALGDAVSRSMDWQANRMEGVLTFSNADAVIALEPQRWL